MKQLSSLAFNRLLDRVRLFYPVKVFTDSPISSGNHAWGVNTVYDSIKMKWSASLRAGSVNCQPAVIKMTFSDSPQAFQDYRNMLPNPPRPKDRVGVPLDYEPRIDLDWRAVGSGASPESTSAQNEEIKTSYERVPTYFKNLGVLDGGTTAKANQQERKLYACDIVLTRSRVYLVADVAVTQNPLFTTSLVSINAAGRVPADVNEPAVVSAQAKFAVPAYSPTLENVFFGQFDDSGEDIILLSTVYALSPPVDSPNYTANIDQSYTLETKYFCYYNLQHATQRLVVQTQQPLKLLVTGLAAGIGDSLFNSLNAQFNDAGQSVLNLFNQRDLRGIFYAI